MKVFYFSMAKTPPKRSSRQKEKHEKKKAARKRIQLQMAVTNETEEERNKHEEVDEYLERMKKEYDLFVNANEVNVIEYTAPEYDYETIEHSHQIEEYVPISTCPYPKV